MLFSRRHLLKKVAVGTGFALGGLEFQASPVPSNSYNGPAVKAHQSVDPSEPPSGPNPVFEKPAPITLAELAQRKMPGVWVAEVSDYAPAHYQGDLKLSPPHADHNAKKALIVVWANKSHRLVFSHEASYDPWIELPNGAALCNQFFEGNNGWAELFNENGRKERNSFVDIVQSGPHRVWVRWNYLCVNKDDDSHPALRGTEDYIAYPNGLVWRRLTYESLMPDKPEGYSWQPIDFFSAVPTGTI